MPSTSSARRPCSFSESFGGRVMRRCVKTPRFILRQLGSRLTKQTNMQNTAGFFFLCWLLVVACWFAVSLFLVVVVVVVVGVYFFTAPSPKRNQLQKPMFDSASRAGFRALEIPFRKNQRTYYVAGGFNQSEKYQSNWIISPGFGVKIKNI